ncbi:hypothetical protein [Pseudoduganella flava]|uniref:Uncharacterized protein n=1 Tax=Pseudoduganella flava TaxID=871742 RepID=A0ABX6FYU9_9BURK|nr:hypothetical protein [Pseudoduganella flava]QGZ41753.1 hypothetical protein GO485_23650 [Pseudoduganella flava]
MAELAPHLLPNSLPNFCARTFFPYESRGLRDTGSLAHNIVHSFCAEGAQDARGNVKSGNFLSLHCFSAGLFFSCKSKTLLVINGLANNLINSLCAEPNILKRTVRSAAANFLRKEIFPFHISTLGVRRGRCQQFCPQKMLRTAQTRPWKNAAQKTRS